MTEDKPLRVVVVGPPLSASGGIGRVMSYALAAFATQDVHPRVLDTRGLRSRPWLSVFPLLKSAVTLVWLGSRGRVDVAHVNISSHGSALRKGLIVRICRLVRIPVVLHLHASSFPEFFDALPEPVQRWMSRTFGLAARVIVLGQVWRRYAVDVLGVPPERVTVLRNATASAAVAAAHVPTEPLHIVFLGRLGSRKGLPELLEALADVRLRENAWRATVAGDGDIETFGARAIELGLRGRIRFPGWVSADDVQDILADAHVLVLPSHAEGLPMSVLEAFAAGVPVVCTPVGGLPEVVLEGVNGLIVPPGDVEALSIALLRLLEDESLRSRLAAGALATWERDHAIEQYARRLTEEWQLAAGRAALATADRVAAVEG